MDKELGILKEKFVNEETVSTSSSSGNWLLTFCYVNNLTLLFLQRKVYSIHDAIAKEDQFKGTES